MGWNGMNGMEKWQMGSVEKQQQQNSSKTTAADDLNEYEWAETERDEAKTDTENEAGNFFYARENEATNKAHDMRGKAVFNTRTPLS